MASLTLKPISRLFSTTHVSIVYGTNEASTGIVVGIDDYRNLRTEVTGTTLNVKVGADRDLFTLPCRNLKEAIRFQKMLHGIRGGILGWMKGSPLKIAGVVVVAFVAWNMLVGALTAVATAPAAIASTGQFDQQLAAMVNAQAQPVNPETGLPPFAFNPKITVPKMESTVLNCPERK